MAIESFTLSSSEDVRNYLDTHVVPVLSKAVTEMCLAAPTDPFVCGATPRLTSQEWLAQWLLKHNPNRTTQGIWVRCVLAHFTPADERHVLEAWCRRILWRDSALN